MRILLLENIHPMAIDELRLQGFEVEAVDRALNETELIDRLKGVQALGIRSKTQVTAKVIKAANDLQVVGCFCIGTNQVAVEEANRNGIPVFNAPFSNTRSVAEMMISHCIALARQLHDRNRELHQGEWNKTSVGCLEVRGKTLGIVGYGNIGSQVSMMAENLGMRVLFYDVISKLSLGNAKPAISLEMLLQESDFVTLHVPATSQTANLIGPRELALMKRGSFLLNASRGSVVDLTALSQSLNSGHLAGAAIDVFPIEPEKNGKSFESPIQGLANVILTPHIGGATEEAQANIGREVSERLVSFLNRGSTLGSVNFPLVDLPKARHLHRVINVHKNIPGVLREVNRIIADHGANIEAQGLSTDPNIGYLVMDLNQSVAQAVMTDISALKSSIRTRIL